MVFVAKSRSQKSGAASVGRKTRALTSSGRAIAACTNADGWQIDGGAVRSRPGERSLASYEWAAALSPSLHARSNWVTSGGVGDTKRLLRVMRCSFSNVFDGVTTIDRPN